MFYFVLVVVPVVVLSLTFLLGAFSSSLTAGLVMSGVYALFLLVGTVAYRIYKKAYEWEQGSIIREMKAIHLKNNPNPRPSPFTKQSLQEAGERAKQRDREIAAMTTRTWNRTPTTEEEEA